MTRVAPISLSLSLSLSLFGKRDGGGEVEGKKTDEQNIFVTFN